MIEKERTKANDESFYSLVDLRSKERAATFGKDFERKKKKTNETKKKRKKKKKDII